MIATNQTLTNQINFSSGIAVKGIKFIITDAVGDKICVKVDIVGCDITGMDKRVTITFIAIHSIISHI